MAPNSHPRPTNRTDDPLSTAATLATNHASCVAAGGALAGTLAVATAAVVASGAVPALV